HIHRVAGMTVGTGWLTLGPVVAAVIGTEYDITAAGDQVHIGDIAFRRAIYIRWNEAMIEDNDGPSRGRLLTMRNRHQCIDLETLGQVRNIIAVVIDARIQH